MYISVRICKFKIFKQKSHFKKNVIAIAIAQNVPLYGQTLISHKKIVFCVVRDIYCLLLYRKR